MAQGCLLVLCGLPASGKSAIAARLQDHSNTILPGDLCVFHVHYDRLIPSDVERQLIQLSVEQGASNWKSVRSQVLSCVDCLLNRLAQYGSDCFVASFAFPADSFQMKGAAEVPAYTSSGDCEANCHLVKPGNVDGDLWSRFISTIQESMAVYRNCYVTARKTEAKQWMVLIDDNMQYSSMRYEYCQLARKYALAFCIVHVSCPVEELMARNSMRENRVAEHVIWTMQERFEVPDSLKRPWEKYSLSVTAETSADVLQILDLTQQAMADPQQPLPQEDEEEKDASRFICSTNVIHQVDQILRRCLSNTMTSLKDTGTSKDEMKRLAASLSHLRVSILDSMRRGDITLPFDPDKDLGVDASKDPNSRLYQFVEALFSARCKETR